MTSLLIRLCTNPPPRHGEHLALEILALAFGLALDFQINAAAPLPPATHWRALRSGSETSSPDLPTDPRARDSERDSWCTGCRANGAPRKPRRRAYASARPAA